MELLYRVAEWHGFAKLRLHTDSTLEHLNMLTKDFGRLMRQFRDQTCPQFQTVELPREVAARKRKGAQAPLVVSSSSASSSRKSKTLNLFTPKFHSLGDYVHTIQRFGCTDSFSTQVVWRQNLYAQIKTDDHVGRVGSPSGKAALWKNQQTRCNQADRTASQPSGAS